MTLLCPQLVPFFLSFFFFFAGSLHINVCFTLRTASASFTRPTPKDQIKLQESRDPTFSPIFIPISLHCVPISIFYSFQSSPSSHILHERLYLRIHQACLDIPHFHSHQPSYTWVRIHKSRHHSMLAFLIEAH